MLFTVFFLLLFSCNNKKTNKENSMDEFDSIEIQDTTKLKDTEIYLTVIKEITKETDIKDCIQFSDNRDDLVSIPGYPEYFISKVNPSKKVTWMGSKDSDPSIKIIEVNFKSKIGSTDILEKVKMKEKNGVVEGKVKMKGENLSNEFYSITFSINNDTITIDPVIQLHNY